MGGYANFHEHRDTTRRVFHIRILSFTVATIAISSVSLSFYLSITNAVVGTDGLYFVRSATALVPPLAVRSSAYVGDAGVYIHSLYGVATLMMSVLVGEIDLAGNVVSSLSWAATLPLFFLVCRKLYGVKAAYLSTVLLSTNKWMLRYSYVMLTEALYIVLSVSSLLACIHLVELLRGVPSGTSKRLLVLSSSTASLLAALYLTGPEAIPVVLSVLAFLCLWAVARRRTDVGLAAAIMMVTMVTFVLILLLPLLFQDRYAGYGFFLPKMGRVKAAIRGFVVPESRSSFLGRYLTGGYQYAVTFSGMLGSLGVAMIVLLGIITVLPPIRFREARKERLLPILFLSPLLILPAVLGVVEYRSRFAIPYLFILIIWVGAGAVQVGERLGKRHATLAIAIILIAISMLYSRDVLSWPYSHVHLPMKQVGLWMKDNLPAQDLEGETILGRRGAVIADFYTGGKLKVSGLRGLEFSTQRELVGYMKANDIRYLLVDAVYTPESHPDLAFLLSDFQAARRLGLEVVRVEEGRTNTSVLYELRDVRDSDGR